MTAAPGAGATTRVVALTGNIAAGKSTVARLLAERGATIVDADLLARAAVAPGTPGLAAIAQVFGPGVLSADGALDRAALRAIVFRDPVARARLDTIVHPEVGRLRDAAVAAATARGDRLVVCDIPLLFETGRDADYDTIILVDAPEAVRHDRLVRDRGLSPDEAAAMMAAQLSSAAKRTRATYVLDNAGSPEALAAAVDRLVTQLRPAGH